MFDEVLGLWGNVLVLFGALAVLAKASDVAINNSVKVADITGFGRTTIGFILVAFSTSLPELLVAVFAAIRQEAVGVAVGNVLGSKRAPQTTVPVSVVHVRIQPCRVFLSPAPFSEKCFSRLLLLPRARAQDLQR